MESDQEAKHLEDLAERLKGLTKAQAQALADAQGVRLRVRDQYGVAYHDDAKPGRITVDAYEGVVTRSQRG